MSNIADAIAVAKSQIDVILTNLQRMAEDSAQSNPNEPRAGYVIDLSEPSPNVPSPLAEKAAC
jgi:hypothetical protein